jgi:transcriptional regulator with XRE-family HTH domain
MSNNISLAAARTRANVTQSDAARKMNVSVQTMWKWEKGIAPVARRHWARLASLLRVKEDELEEILVQTLLDACLSNHDSRPLRNAQASRLYRSDLLFAALAEFENAAAPYQYPQNPKPASEESTVSELERVRFERELLERDRRIFELEKQVDELKRELEQARRPAASLSSVLNINKLEHEVK